MNVYQPQGGMANSKVSLDLRGRRISIERESLMELPESVLLCLFPNGVVLSPQRQQGQVEDDQAEDVYFVDFDGDCLEFVLSFFSQARDGFYGPPSGPRRDLSLSQSQQQTQNPLFLKQAIIVLREELEYFAIPPTSPSHLDNTIPGTTDAGLPNKALLALKQECGNALLDRTSIFTALQRNVNRENNVAEQHLIDMLCMSGFAPDDVWGYRSLEPNRCCIASIALVLLKTGIVHPPIGQEGSHPGAGDDDAHRIQIDAQQLATAQKLLLFWRKPARKCWWDATELTLDEGLKTQREIKVWARRVWTLELSLI